MNLQQLRYLVAVADHGTMTAAAAAVPVAQPVISRAVRSLERELAVSLLRTVGRGVELTDVGLEVVDRARAVLDGVDSIAGIGARSTTPETVRIGLTPAVEERYTRQLLDAASLHPELELSTRSILHNAEGFELVLHGDLELSVTTDSVAPKPLVQHQLGSFDLGLLCCDDHEFDVPVPIARLDELPLIWFRQGNPRSANVLARLAAAGIRPDITVETGDRLAWPSLVRSQHGHAIVPTNMAPEPGLVILPFEPPLRFPVTLVHRQLPTESPLHALVESIVRQFDPDARR